MNGNEHLHRRLVPASPHVLTLRHLSTTASFIENKTKNTKYNSQNSNQIVLIPFSLCALCLSKAKSENAAVSFVHVSDVVGLSRWRTCMPSPRAGLPRDSQSANGGAPLARSFLIPLAYARARSVTSAFSACPHERQTAPSLHTVRPEKVTLTPFFRAIYMQIWLQEPFCDSHSPS